MTRLTDLRGIQTDGAAVRWDQRSLDVVSVIQTARTLRADYIADRLRRGLAFFGRRSGLTDLYAALRRRNHRRRTLRQLTALDDRLLSDIGVNRADIEATAAFCCDKESPAAGASIWHGLFARAGREMRRRKTIRELSAMSDSLLADIGIERAQIPTVAAALVDETNLRPDSGPAKPTAEAQAMAQVPVAARVLAFTEMRRNLRRAVNENHSRSTAA
ncbi:MAG: DUF1127 domain-containing protein [Kiloniellaceae bacterium]